MHNFHYDNIKKIQVPYIIAQYENYIRSRKHIKYVFLIKINIPSETRNSAQLFHAVCSTCYYNIAAAAVQKLSSSFLTLLTVQLMLYNMEW
jgi:hypothetical protein